jgi:hypothetical protein
MGMIQMTYDLALVPWSERNSLSSQGCNSLHIFHLLMYSTWVSIQNHHFNSVLNLHSEKKYKIKSLSLSNW